MLDTVSSMHSLSVLLSAVEMTHINSSSASMVTVVRNHSHMCAHAAFTTRSYYMRVVFTLFKSFGLCGYYSRVATIRRKMVTQFLHGCSMLENIEQVCSVWNISLVPRPHPLMRKKQCGGPSSVFWASMHF